MKKLLVLVIILGISVGSMAQGAFACAAEKEAHLEHLAEGEE